MTSLHVLPSLSFSCQHPLRSGHHLSAERLFNFLRSDILICDGCGITQFLLDDGLGVLPYLFKLFRDSGYARMYGLAPDERITVGIRLHLRPVGTGHIQTYKTFRHEKLYNGGKYFFSTSFSRLLRKRLMVLWSGVTLPVSHMKRMSLRQNSSMRRLE